ncbi:hypothetical protein KCU83_g227, partial [Aureobasidium melanogenum]
MRLHGLQPTLFAFMFLDTSFDSDGGLLGGCYECTELQFSTVCFLQLHYTFLSFCQAVNTTFTRVLGISGSADDMPMVRLAFPQLLLSSHLKF